MFSSAYLLVMNFCVLLACAAEIGDFLWWFSWPVRICLFDSGYTRKGWY